MEKTTRSLEEIKRSMFNFSRNMYSLKDRRLYGKKLWDERSDHSWQNHKIWDWRRTGPLFKDIQFKLNQCDLDIKCFIDFGDIDYNYCYVYF